MLIKKSFINGKIIFGNGDIILPLKNIDRVSVETEFLLNLIKIYWSKSKKIKAPQIIHTKKSNFSNPVYITTHGGIFKIDNVISTWFTLSYKNIIYTEIAFSGTYSNSELENLETRINTILFLTSPMLISDTNVTKEIPS